MKKKYFSPSSDSVEFYPADGVLNNASNEGYDVDPFNPGFTPMPDNTFDNL